MSDSVNGNPTFDNFFDPELLKANLISASLFVTAWETLKTCVIDQPKTFFTFGDRSDDNYRREVLDRDKSPFRASLLWFKESGAIDDADIELADRIRTHRNEIAHELPAFVMSYREIDVQLLTDLTDLVGKIDRWWIREIEMSINPQFDGVDPNEVPDEQIHSGRMMILSTMLQLATADAEQTKEWNDMIAAMKQRATSGAKS